MSNEYDDDAKKIDSEGESEEKESLDDSFSENTSDEEIFSDSNTDPDPENPTSESSSESSADSKSEDSPQGRLSSSQERAGSESQKGWKSARESLSNLWYGMHQSKFLPPSVQIEEGYDLRLTNLAMFILILLLVALIIWASLTNIEEVAVTNGQIIPINKVQPVQHLEGGIVAELLVRDGDEVKQGQVLARLDAAQAISELRQMEVRDAGLIYQRDDAEDRTVEELNVTNVNASNASANDANAEQPKFPKYEDILEKDMLEKQFNKQTNLQSIKTQNDDDNQKDDSQKIETRKDDNQLKNASDSNSPFNKNYSKIDESAKIYNKNVENKSIENKGIENKDRVRKIRTMERNKCILYTVPEICFNEEEGFQLILNALSREKELLSYYEGQIYRMNEQLKVLIEQLHMIDSLVREGAATRREFLEIKLEYARVQYEKSKILSEHLETRYAIERLQDKVDKLEIRASVSGIVKGLLVDRGRVIQPGGTLMEIVPVQEQLVVETRIATNDIGHVKVGQPVKVKVLTFNYTQYGIIEGKLTYVAASSTMDEKGVPYFRGIIELQQPYVGNDPRIYRLRPGMTVQADVKTGVKSLLRALLTPIRIITTSAFHER